MSGSSPITTHKPKTTTIKAANFPATSSHGRTNGAASNSKLPCARSAASVRIVKRNDHHKEILDIKHHQGDDALVKNEEIRRLGVGARM